MTDQPNGNSIQPMAHRLARHAWIEGDRRGAEDFGAAAHLEHMPPPPPKVKKSSMHDVGRLKSFNNTSSTSSRSRSRSSSRSGSESSEAEFPLGVEGSMIGRETLSQRQETSLLTELGEKYKATFEKNKNLPLSIDGTFSADIIMDELLSNVDDKVAEIKENILNRASEHKMVLARIGQCYKKNYKIFESGHISKKIHPYGSYMIGTKPGRQIRVTDAGEVDNPEVTPVDIHRLFEDPPLIHKEYDEFALSLLTLWRENEILTRPSALGKINTWLNSANRDYKIKFIKTLLLEDTSEFTREKINRAIECREMVIRDGMINSLTTFLKTFNKEYPGFKIIMPIIYGLLKNVNTRGTTLKYSAQLPIIIFIFHLIKMTIEDSSKELAPEMQRMYYNLSNLYLKLLIHYDIGKETIDKNFKKFSRGFSAVFNKLTKLAKNEKAKELLARMLHELLDTVAFIYSEGLAVEKRRDQGMAFMALHATIDSVLGGATVIRKGVSWVSKVLKYILGQDVRVEPARGARVARVAPRAAYSSRSNALSASQPPGWRQRVPRPSKLIRSENKKYTKKRSRPASKVNSGSNSRSGSNSESELPKKRPRIASKKKRPRSSSRSRSRSRSGSNSESELQKKRP